MTHGNAIINVTIRRVFSAFLIVLFTAQSCYCSDITAIGTHYAGDKLAPRTLFQKAFASESSPEFKDSILSDIRLITLSFSIASHFLSDQPLKSVEDLRNVIRNEFRNDRPLITLLDNAINLAAVSYKDGIVHIPLNRDGKNYEVQICPRSEFDKIKDRTPCWAVSPNFAIQALELKPEQPKSISNRGHRLAVLAKFRAAIRRAVKENKAIVWFSDMDGTLTSAGVSTSDRIIRDIRVITARSDGQFAIVTGVGSDRLHQYILSPSTIEARRAEREDDLANLIGASNNGSEIYEYDPESRGFVREAYVDLKKLLGKKYDRLNAIIRQCIRDMKMGAMVKDLMGWDDFEGDPIDERPDREHPSQVSLMVLGNEATSRDKDRFAQAEDDPGSPYFKVRENRYLPFLKKAFRDAGIDVEVRISGKSSIDITVIDKAGAIRRIITRLRELGKIPQGRPLMIIYSGDSFGPGENDEPAIDVADIIINVGSEPPLRNFSGEAYFSLPDMGPEGMAEFLEAYILEKYPPPAISGVDEPLIGHGFACEDLNKVEVAPWEQSQIFAETVAELEDIIRARAPGVFREGLLATIEKYKGAGYKLGMSTPVYIDSQHYHLGFGTLKAVALARDFFDPSDPLYQYRHEALFHEIFHAFRKGTDEEDVEADIDAHREAMRLGAVIFWDLSEEDVRWITLADLESHPNNGLGRAIRAWKDKQSKISERMAGDHWQELLIELRSTIKACKRRNAKRLFDFLAECNRVAQEGANRLAPVETRYPILRAVSMLDRSEAEYLLKVFKRPENLHFRDENPMIDAIMLMIDNEIPEDWVDKQAPELIGCNIYQSSAEIWSPGGGLGRVMQYHGTGIYELLGPKYRHQLLSIEAGYHYRQQKCYLDPERAEWEWVKMDYSSPDSMSYPIRDAEVIDAFTVRVNHGERKVVAYAGKNDLGIECILLQDELDEDGFSCTHSLYNYKSKDDPYLPTWGEFTEFMGRTITEFIVRRETKELAEKGDKWRPPVLNTNDSQLSLVGYYMLSPEYMDDERVAEMAQNAFVRELFGNIPITKDTLFSLVSDSVRDRVNGDLKRHIIISMFNPVVRAMLLAAVTHTYDNRKFIHGVKDGNQFLKDLNINLAVQDFFDRGVGSEKGRDFASALIRFAAFWDGWEGNVARKHGDDIRSWDDWWPNVHAISVTNGDMREHTAAVFRRIMSDLAQSDPDIRVPGLPAYLFREVFPGKRADHEYPNENQILATKIRAKEALALRDGQYFTTRYATEAHVLDPEQYVISYTGRLVPEKAGRTRALSDTNIRELMKKGIQVMVYGNVQSNEESQSLEAGLLKLIRSTKAFVEKSDIIRAFGGISPAEADEIWSTLLAHEFMDSAGNVRSDFDDSFKEKLAEFFGKDKAGVIFGLLSKRLDNSIKYPGRLVFVPTFTLDDQRMALAASDVGVVDSDPGTEAAGFSETDFASCGAIVLAPPWPGGEGILVSQGSRLNMDYPGDGNTLIPEIPADEYDLGKVHIAGDESAEKVEKAYRDILLKFFDLTPLEIARYMGSSIRFSRVLGYRMTSAEYLRQWAGAARRKAERAQKYEQLLRTPPGAETPEAIAGSIKNGLKTLITIREFFTTGVTFKEFVAARLARHKMSDGTFRQEMIELQRLNIVKQVWQASLSRRCVYMLHDDIRNLSPPSRDAVIKVLLAMPELSHASVCPALRDNITRIVEPYRRQEQIAKDIETIHSINMAQYPSVPDGKTLCKVVPLEFIPQSMRMKFYTMVTRLNQRHPELREKIIVTTGRQGLVEKVNELLEDPNNIVMAAVADENDLARLPQVGGERLRALLFKGEAGDLNSFKQVECILAALRALYRSDVTALKALYKLTTGSELAVTDDILIAALNNPQELAKKIIFNLKPILIENAELRSRLNSRLLDLIRESA